MEGALLAVGASLAAVLAHRGVIELGRSSLRYLIAIAGIGVALASAWTDVSTSVSGSIWSSQSLGGKSLGATLLVLIALCVVLVVLSFALKQKKRLLFGASVIGWIIAGYCATTIALIFPKLGSLGPAYWLGLAGGAAIGLSTVSLRPLLVDRIKRPRRLAIVSTPRLQLAPGSPSRWHRSGSPCFPRSPFRASSSPPLPLTGTGSTETIPWGS